METSTAYFPIRPQDPIEIVVANAERCLCREGFFVTGDGQFQPHPDTLRRCTEHLMRLAPPEPRVHGSRPPICLHTARAHTERLLATWGLRDGISFSEPEKMVWLERLRFGKGGKHNRYGDARWSPLAREEALLATFGFESAVPEALHLCLTFLVARGLRATIHRKPVTFGCQEAARYRFDSIRRTRGVPLHEELKTLVVKGYKRATGAPVFLAVHLCGDHIIDLQRVRTVLRDQQATLLCDPPQLDAAASRELGLAAGRLNIVSLTHAAQQRAVSLMHLCDDALMTTPGQKAYTNVGLNTWGMEILDVAHLIQVIQEETQRGLLTGTTSAEHTVLIAPLSQPPFPASAVPRSPTQRQTAWPVTAASPEGLPDGTP
jgi:hypothetical protein